MNIGTACGSLVIHDKTDKKFCLTVLLCLNLQQGSYGTGGFGTMVRPFGMSQVK